MWILRVIADIYDLIFDITAAVAILWGTAVHSFHTIGSNVRLVRMSCLERTQRYAIVVGVGAIPPVDEPSTGNSKEYWAKIKKANMAVRWMRAKVEK